MTDRIAWKPKAPIINNANIKKFMDRHEIKSYEELIQRARTGIEWFWDSCVHETDIAWSEPYTQLVDASDGFSNTRWFIGGKLNIATNCVDRHLENRAAAKKTALIWTGENGTVRQLTYEELAAQTNHVAQYLISQGVGQHEFVACYLPIVPELLPIFFGILKAGAIVLPLPLSFSSQDVAVYCKHTNSKVLFTAEATYQKGQLRPIKNTLEPAFSQMTTLQRCVVVRRHLKPECDMLSGRDIFYDDLMAHTEQNTDSQAMSSEHPAVICFSAGTTGQPKAFIHSHAGIMAQVSKDFFFNLDLKKKDVFFWLTDTSSFLCFWEIIGVTHFGATLVMMEGDACYPRADRIFQICQDFQVTHFGLSPDVAAQIRTSNKTLSKKIQLKKMRVLGSAGCAWDPVVYDWFSAVLGNDKLPVVNMYMAAEFMGSVLAPLVIHEIKKCSLQSPGLGMSVDVFAEAGYSVFQSGAGYLVCKKPAPSMAKGWLHGQEAFQKHYLSKYKNVWIQNDWVYCDEEGHWFFVSRISDTVQCGEKRFALVEVEQCLQQHVFVKQARVVKNSDQGDDNPVSCFVVLDQTVGKTRFLVQELKNWLAQKLERELISCSLVIEEDLS